MLMSPDVRNECTRWRLTARRLVVHYRAYRHTATCQQCNKYEGFINSGIKMLYLSISGIMSTNLNLPHLSVKCITQTVTWKFCPCVCSVYLVWDLSTRACIFAMSNQQPSNQKYKDKGHIWWINQWIKPLTGTMFDVSWYKWTPSSQSDSNTDSGVNPLLCSLRGASAQFRMQTFRWRLLILSDIWCPAV